MSVVFFSTFTQRYVSQAEAYFTCPFSFTSAHLCCVRFLAVVNSIAVITRVQVLKVREVFSDGDSGYPGRWSLLSHVKKVSELGP